MSSAQSAQGYPCGHVTLLGLYLAVTELCRDVHPTSRTYHELAHRLVVDVEQYVAYRAYYYGYADSGEELSEEARLRAENNLKEEIFYDMVDDFVYENTVQKN